MGTAREDDADTGRPLTGDRSGDLDWLCADTGRDEDADMGRPLMGDRSGDVDWFGEIFFIAARLARLKGDSRGDSHSPPVSSIITDCPRWPREKEDFTLHCAWLDAVSVRFVPDKNLSLDPVKYVASNSLELRRCVLALLNRSGDMVLPLLLSNSISANISPNPSL
jgi:hypothetical protein